MAEFNNSIPTGNSKEDIMRFFIGSNADYYMNYYRKFKETGKKFSWNWSACIFSPIWFFARKMYLLGAIATTNFVMFGQGTTLLMKHNKNEQIMELAMPWCFAFFAFVIILGALGNYFYMGHIESKVIYPGEDGINSEDAARLNLLRGGLSINSIINGILITYIVESLVQMLISFV